MQIRFLTVTVSAILLLMNGCADLQNDLPAPVASAVQVHQPGWVDTTSPDFHGVAIRKANWDMTSCKTCHGQNYDGGTSNESCSQCHSKPGGPENCATCHGSVNPAPPRDLSGNDSVRFRGVGAHQRHLLGSAIAGAMYCNDCHIVPGPIYATGHIDNTPHAEVVMSNPLARTVTNTGTNFPLLTGGPITPNPSYDAATLTCASTYCHGNFKNGNRSFAPVWNNATGSQMACGTCHGDVNASTTYRKALPGGTHPDPAGITTCATATSCHVGVIDVNFRILDPSKHVNGKLNLGGLEFDY